MVVTVPLTAKAAADSRKGWKIKKQLWSQIGNHKWWASLLSYFLLQLAVAN
jgi:hypothetical protein